MSADPPAVPTTGLLLQRSASAKLKNLFENTKNIHKKTLNINVFPKFEMRLIVIACWV